MQQCTRSERLIKKRSLPTIHGVRFAEMEGRKDLLSAQEDSERSEDRKEDNKARAVLRTEEYVHQSSTQKNCEGGQQP